MIAFIQFDLVFIIPYKLVITTVALIILLTIMDVVILSYICLVVILSIKLDTSPEKENIQVEIV